MDNKTDKFKQKIGELRERMHEERKKIQKIDELVNRKVERAPGIWEYDFDELESEIWNRYESLEKKTEDLSKEISGCSGKSPLSLFKFFRNLRGNIIRQNVINQEMIPFYLATILSLQRIKDRLNSLEYRVKKIDREKEDLISEVEEYKAELKKKEGKKKIDG